MLLQNRYDRTKKCPNCLSDRVRRVRRENGFDSLLSIVNFYPYHCLECPSDNRFHRFGRSR